MTTLSVAWFLLRVIPKPIRATYPCQQAAFPLLSSAVIWLLGIKSGIIGWIQMNRRWKRVRPALFAICLVLVLALVTWAAEYSPWVTAPRRLGLTMGNPSGDAPNAPIGVAKGIFPGRVTWIRDTNATPWDGKSGYWWQETNVNQTAVDRMTSLSLRALTGAGSDAQAWSNVFRYYNSTHGRGDTGYAPAERIAIKINLNNNLGDYGSNNWAEASKQTVVSLLRQLVNKAGVSQSNICVYDAVRTVPAWLYAGCQPEFPGIQWYSNDSWPVRSNFWRATWVTNSSHFSVSNDCGGPLIVPACVSQATYLINLPLLKGHVYAGVTLAAKNHYGSIPQRDHSAFLQAWQTNQPLYSMLVDLMGSRELGDKTILYVNDALFGNVSNYTENNPANCAFSNLFNGQWSSSLFMSLDPVAIDSVCADFLYAEFGSRLGTLGIAPLPVTNCDHYLHEAALAGSPPSGTIYKPDGVRLSSLGTHEHWNNPIDKKYSRNLSPTGAGIELMTLQDTPSALLTITSPANGAVFGDGNIPLAAAAHDNYSAIQKVDFYGNGIRLGTATNASLSCVWTNPPWGVWHLTAVGTDADGYCTTSAVVTVDVGVNVTIVAPADRATVIEGTNLPIEVRADSAFGPVTNVDIYAGNQRLATRTNAPFSLVWSNVPAGTWSLTAIARDTAGVEVTSTPVRLEAKRDIRVALVQPPSGSIFPPATSITLCADAKSILTAIDHVDFYSGAAFIGRATQSPYTIIWNNPPPGAWSLTAVATETAGFSASSVAAAVAVKPSAPQSAGTVYVDLRMSNCAPNCAIWTNVGSLGNFTPGNDAWGLAPAFEINAVGTYLPACRFDGGSSWFGGHCMVGPMPVADITGSSDRTLEIWALRPSPLDSQNALIQWGFFDRCFVARYGSDLTFGAFSEYSDTSPEAFGWQTESNIPPAIVWHHLVYAYDGTTNFNVYVDGALCVAKTLPAPLNTSLSGSDQPITLGKAWTAWSTYFLNGYINSVRIHGGLLTPEAVKLNYLAGPCEGNDAPIAILTEPQDLRVKEGKYATLSVVAQATTPLSFQWYLNGLPIPDATNSSCLLTGLQWSDNGAHFCCLISRTFDKTACTAVTRTATLTITPKLPALSCSFSTNEQITLSFSVVQGSCYQAEYTDRLDTPDWKPLSPPQTASDVVMIISDAIGHQQRFYRVSRLP